MSRPIRSRLRTASVDWHGTSSGPEEKAARTSRKDRALKFVAVRSRRLSGDGSLRRSAEATFRPMYPRISVPAGPTEILRLPPPCQSQIGSVVGRHSTRQNSEESSNARIPVILRSEATKNLFTSGGIGNKWHAFQTRFRFIQRDPSADGCRHQDDGSKCGKKRLSEGTLDFCRV